jgi:hypothetical protein
MLYFANDRTAKAKSQKRKGQSDMLFLPATFNASIKIEQQISCNF